MKTITLQDIKRFGSKALNVDGPLYLIVNSKPKSVILPVDDYESMIEMLEDFDDLRVIKERENDETISYEEAFPNGMAA